MSDSKKYLHMGDEELARELSLIASSEAARYTSSKKDRSEINAEITEEIDKLTGLKAFVDFDSNGTQTRIMGMVGNPFSGNQISF